MDLFKKTHAIYNGWKNYIGFDDLPEQFKKKARLRGEICCSCEFLDTSWLVRVLAWFNIVKPAEKYKCGKCGCPITQKVLQDIEPCPEGKWK